MTDWWQSLSGLNQTLYGLAICVSVPFVWQFAAALYLERGLPLPRVFGSAVVWGLGGMSSVALLLHLLPRLAHSGTRDLDSALGSEATVYIDIPSGGTGEVRVLVSGSVGYVKARAIDGRAIPAGTPVAVRRRIGQTLLVVEPVTPAPSNPTGECP